MNQIRLTVGGVKYTVKSDENAEYLNALGNELEDRLRRITKRNPTLSTTMVAIIAALEASDEAKKAKDELFAIKKKYENNKFTTKYIKEEAVEYSLSPQLLPIKKCLQPPFAAAPMPFIWAQRNFQPEEMPKILISTGLKKP